ncbi:hypothetical protein [Xenorhabdus kozodoii]|uniref:T3SS effector protein EspK n=1 Tax=Xenorhabdus kozodoii TaxID=351676 RepID=A0A2D0L0V5_9GAMM|nr:hypothetical protein [Xenorhabdus kozodoii]PHM69300.1 T3SS effector protein EspK [Xenorhabdus kozodoii]
MPFREPFKRKFDVGDLIYGLTSQRLKYITNYKPFKGISINTHKVGIQAVIIDQYITPVELFLKKNDEEARKNNMKLEINRPYSECFSSYIKNHHKYHSSFEFTPESTGRIFSRKCKAGLSWITMSNGNKELVKDNTVHFILDAIEMKYVVNKVKFSAKSTDITSHELRWVYRNRNNINVQKKIQFWLNGQPTIPPWESPEGKEIWKLYTPTSELEAAFN